MGRTTHEGHRRRASHPSVDKRPKARQGRRRGQLPSAFFTNSWTPGCTKMSSPTVSVLSMGHLGTSGGAGAPRVNLGVGGRRGSASSDIGSDRRGSGDIGILRRGSGGSEDARGVGGGGGGGGVGGGGGGGGEGGRSGGVVHFAEDKNSVFSSSSYAASRGLQRTSPSRPVPGVDLSHPVAPPRAKGAAAAITSLFSSSPSKATGIMKSSSEIFISTPAAAPSAAAPTKGILKSPSGTLKTNNGAAPLSRSHSGGVLPTANRVNFSDTVCDINDVLASSPSSSSSSAPQEASSTGPTGRTLTRQSEEGTPVQQPPPRKKAEAAAHSLHYPRAQYPHQKESQQKGTQHPQTKEALPQVHQKGTQHPQHRDADKNHDLQQQVKILQLKDDSRSASHGKLQQTKEHEAHQSQKLKQQHRETEKQELLKQQQQAKQQKQQQLHQQNSPKIDIPEAKHRVGEEYQRDQQFQQLVRAGSLGSGESAAILHQRSRSPLPSPNRQSRSIGQNDKQVIPPIVVTVNSSPSADRKTPNTGSFQAHTFHITETVTHTERTKTNSATGKNEVLESGSKSASPNPTPLSGAAAVETRTGVIRAAAKAYTENFQSYSYSSYLTKNRKDSVPCKEISTVTRDLQESSSEIKLPSGPATPNNSPSSSGSNSPPANTYNSTARPYTRGTAGKIIVPLEPFIPSSTNKGTPLTNDILLDKQATAAEKVTKPKKPDQSKETPGHSSQKTAIQKVNNAAVKSQTGGPSIHSGQGTPNTHQQVTASKTPVNQKELVKTTREKSINSSGPISSSQSSTSVKHPNTPAPPNKREGKTLPPLLSHLKFPLLDRMKGSSEGALLVACRVAEEDQVMRLLKELTATGALDATALNQTDRSGRTSLSYSCANAFLRIVESLTAMPGLDINKPDTDGNTPLHFASQAGHTEIVSHLVNKCNRTVDLDARNALGFTPLMKAALQGRTKIAKILLFAGASPHLRDFGRGLCAVEWARYTGRHICSELIDSVQKSCSSHIRERWTSDPDLKSHSSTSINTLGQGDNKESWIKHKIKKAFHKSESKKEFSVVTNLSTMAVCATSPLLPTAVTQEDIKPKQMVVPPIQITEVKVPDCYEDPEDALSRLPPPPPPPILPPEEAAAASSSSSKSPKKQSKNTAAAAAATSSSASTSQATTTTSSSSSSSSQATSSSSTSSSPAPTSSTSTAATAAAAAATTSTTTSSSSPSSSSTTTSSTAATADECQGVVGGGAGGSPGAGSGDAKSNGTAKSIVSSSKMPFSSTKKRK